MFIILYSVSRTTPDAGSNDETGLWEVSLSVCALRRKLIFKRRSRRKNLLSTDRFYFFGLGERHAAAEMPLDIAAVLGNPGPVFEQWVGIELWQRLQYLGAGRLHYFRTKGGAEVDFIIERDHTLTPVEVKWSEKPTHQDARHLLAFLEEYPRQAKLGFIVYRCRHPLRLHDKILALPWFCL
jgi:predicted AAA+ superfamily ATPase